MTITVRFFATYRQLAGVEQIECQIAEAATVAEVITQLEAQYPQLAGKLSAASMLTAINESYAPRAQQLHAGDTLALFPPVSGG
jgi:sulfur-carrier protein